jgi:hypothetical protein
VLCVSAPVQRLGVAVWHARITKLETVRTRWVEIGNNVGRRPRTSWYGSNQCIQRGSCGDGRHTHTMPMHCAATWQPYRVTWCVCWYGVDVCIAEKMGGQAVDIEGASVYRLSAACVCWLTRMYFLPYTLWPCWRLFYRAVSLSICCGEFLFGKTSVL